MKDLTGRTVYYIFLGVDDELTISKVKLTYHVPEEDRDLEDEDEYSGEVVKYIYGPQMDTDILYVSDMFFTDRDCMKAVFKFFK